MWGCFMKKKIITVLSSILLGTTLVSAADACSGYTVKAGDGLWNLNDAFCTAHGVPGTYEQNVFTDDQCSVHKTGTSINAGDKIWFKDGCVVPGGGETGYDNVFLSAMSPADINQYGKYVSDKDLSGLIAWELSDDLPFQDQKSLLHAINSSSDLNGKTIGLYWTDWSIYTTTRNIPSESIQLSGFSDAINALSQNHQVRLYYAFLETVQDSSLSDNKLGTLYFADPWSDLSPENCSDDMLSDSYALKLKNKKESTDKYNCESASKFNNVGTLAKMPNVTSLLSVGGASHDNTFEVTFDGNGGLNQYADNFVNSAKEILDKYKVKGFDLDYENPKMTSNDEKSYILLVKKLREKLGPDAIITVTILQNQDYLSKHFTRLPELNSIVNAINVMTYDYHGAFDFGSGKSNVTGYNSNLFKDEYSPEYSADVSAQAVLDLGVDKSLVSIGVPFYVRSIANIHKGDSYGLAQPLIEGKSLVIPGGDKDAKNCDKDKTCTGIFTYRYYVNNLQKNSTGETYDFNDAASTVTYIGHLDKPTVKNYNLEVSNLSPDTGITVHVGGFTSNYLTQGGDETYNSDTPVSTALIEDHKDLKVTWETWNDSGSCKNMDFTSNKHIMVNPNTKQCDIK